MDFVGKLKCLFCIFTLITVVNGDLNMPQKILCKNCGAVLYTGTELKPPDEIIQQYNGICPRCHNKLFYHPDNVGIRKVE